MQADGVSPRTPDLNQATIGDRSDMPLSSSCFLSASINTNDPAPGTHTNSSLLLGLKENDQAAWQQLIELYGPLVFHWCHRLGLKDADAADVMQEVFFSVSKAAARFSVDRSRGSFRAWLWTITRHKAIDLMRRRPTSCEAVGGTVFLKRIEELPDPCEEDSADISDRSVQLGVYQRALTMIQAEFEPRTWQAFYRSAVAEERTADIAQDLGMSPAAVRKAKSRVLRRLRATLGDSPE